MTPPAAFEIARRRVSGAGDGQNRLCLGWYRNLVRDPRITARSAHAVAWTLQELLSAKEGYAYPTITYLSGALGHPARTIRKAIKQLEELEWILASRRNGTSSRYTINPFKAGTQRDSNNAGPRPTEAAAVTSSAAGPRPTGDGGASHRGRGPRPSGDAVYSKSLKGYSERGLANKTGSKTERQNEHRSKPQVSSQRDLRLFREIHGGLSASVKRTSEAAALHPALVGEPDYAEFVSALTPELETKAASVLAAKGARAAVDFVRGLGSKADDGARAQLTDNPDVPRRQQKHGVAV